VDWGHFGHLTIGRARRPLMAFVLVLSYSRRIFLRFFLDARLENFLRGHAEAFAAWNGVPRVLLYDNLKSAVLERRGDAIRFHPTLIDFAKHHRFEPRPVAVGRGNEKGRVERAIRYVRDNFFAGPIAALLEDRFAGRSIADAETLNAQADEWCRGIAADRRCPGQDATSVREAFAEEAPRLLPLPDNPYPLIEQVAVKAGKTPYIRFDLNDYSIPHTHVRRSLTVFADPREVRIADAGQVLARHPRSYDKGQQIEDEAHNPGAGRAKARRPPSPRHGPPLPGGAGERGLVHACRRTRRQSRRQRRRPHPAAAALRRRRTASRHPRSARSRRSHPMPCASRSNAAARSAACRRPSPSICHSMCGRATFPCGPPASNFTTN
jgi:hypothetical protein